MVAELLLPGEDRPAGPALQLLQGRGVAADRQVALQSLLAVCRQSAQAAIEHLQDSLHCVYGTYIALYLYRGPILPPPFNRSERLLQQEPEGGAGGGDGRGLHLLFVAGGLGGGGGLVVWLPADYRLELRRNIASRLPVLSTELLGQTSGRKGGQLEGGRGVVGQRGRVAVQLGQAVRGEVARLQQRAGELVARVGRGGAPHVLLLTLDMCRVGKV